jgi:hypothetical protein
LQVEHFYISNGYLLPSWHKHYWMGATTEQWPNFNWTDVTLPAFNKGYRHWGTLQPQGIKEPFEADPPEGCMVANYTEVYGNPTAWGWSDTKCNNKFMPMCRINSGLLPLAGMAQCRVLPCVGVRVGELWAWGQLWLVILAGDGQCQLMICCGCA